MKLKHILLFLALIGCMFLIESCSPSKRLARLERRHPELFDTIVIRDTVVVSGSRSDTILSIERILNSRDTIVIHKDRLTQKIFYYRDSLFLQGECQGDTIVREIKVPKVIYLDKPFPGWIYGIIIGSLLLLIGLVSSALRRR